ncbi:MAG TPA: SpoIIE family protein phosphatase, partial [Bacteroidia bacterium]|nr:SpoIIE family protein phosphatase [Bacteroidia bacterium]
IILSISLVNIIAVIIKALKQGKDGARIFALVILLAPVMSYMASKLKTVALFDTLLTDINSGAVFTISLIISLPLSMTIYLARDMARMGKRLTKQLDEITNLSNKTIEQEQEKKRILENQNLDLERNVQQRTLEVVQQKAELEIKNKEITESLHYAKRIQAAILPPTELFTTTFADAFILYLPKDIVSGDFYAYAKKENNIIIAAADCTGHGVSGALMSMIGSSLLNQIVNEKNIIEPGHILNTLNEGIIDALKQRESTSHDGMDIAICQLNLQTLTLRFAGANRPLWLLRNHEIISYQPNKFPIGGLQILHDEVYAEHTIALQKNDVLYLFSDGYADQFGGLHEKKLLTKNLKNHILEIHHLPLSQQRESLLQTFNSWKGKLEQVDDVLVLAVKI